MRFVKENDIEFFAGRSSTSHVSFAYLFGAFARSTLKDFVKAFIVQNNHFLDPSISTHPLNAGAPIGDDAKGADDQYLPLLLRTLENLEDTGPCCEGFSQAYVIGQKKTRIAAFVGAEDLLNSRKLVGLQRNHFLRWNAYECFAVQLPLDLLFPTELLWFKPIQFEWQRLSGSFFEQIGFILGVPTGAGFCGDVSVAEGNIKDDFFHRDLACLCRPEAFQLFRENVSREIPELLFWVPPDAERLCLILLSVSDLEVNHLEG